MTPGGNYMIISIASVYLWIGFVGAISFMEAWLKFRAPGVSVPVGLGIGRIVFRALNRMEWLFAIAIAASSYLSKGTLLQAGYSWFYIAVALLLLQTIWLLPALDRRAQLHIDGKPVPPSMLHFYYVGMELVKVTVLFIFSIKLF